MGEKQQRHQKVMRTVRNNFRPEFLNRLDDIVIFNPLSQTDLQNVLQRQLDAVVKRLAERNIQVILDQGATTAILKEVYNPQYGARPLRQFIEKRIVTEISRMILQGSLPQNATITISAPKLGSQYGLLHYNVSKPEPNTCANGKRNH